LAVCFAASKLVCQTVKDMAKKARQIRESCFIIIGLKQFLSPDLHKINFKSPVFKKSHRYLTKKQQPNHIDI
jgi:hypothetical protein